MAKGKKERRWDPASGEVEREEPIDPPPAAEPASDPAEEPTPPPAENVDPETGEVTEGEQPGPLTQLQDGIRALLDYDQITEVRIALGARRAELTKHSKKGTELGVYEPDAQRRLQILDGTDTKYGLIRVFDRIRDTETQDLFYDREQPNGRPVNRDAGEVLSDADAAALAEETRAAVDAETELAGASA